MEKVKVNILSMKNILICGYGNIGKHVYKELFPLQERSLAEITIYDKYCKEFEHIGLGEKNVYNYTELNFVKAQKFDYCFICVPTEMLNSSGDVDVSEVIQTFNDFQNVETFIIKSAIPVGTCEKIGKDNVIISPEYWGTTQHCPEPNFLVLGGKKEAKDKVVELYNELKSGYYKYYFTDWKTAELVKYMENSWIATKVTFCNEFASIAEKFGIDYNELRELWLADSRVSPSHTLVYKDKPYFDSHCLNKDVPGLISFCKKEGIETPLMESVLKIKKDRES